MERGACDPDRVSIAGVAEQEAPRSRDRPGPDLPGAGVGTTIPSPATARSIVESSARRLVLVVVAPWIVAVSLAALSPDSGWPPEVVVAAAATGLIGYAVLAVTDRRVPLLVLLVTTCVGLGLTSPLGLTLGGSSLIAGWLNLTCFTLGALARWRVGVPVGVATVLATVGLVAARSATAGQPQEPGALVAIALYALNDLAVVALAATILRRTAAESDAAALGRARAAALAARAESGQAELRRVLRLIHDTAMNTLGAVARLSGLGKEGVAQRCASDLEVLRSVDARHDRDPQALLSSIGLRAQQLGLSLDMRPAPPGPLLATGVGKVLEGAAWEALNNIAKHSGQHAATLDWDWDGARGRLAIADRGRGFRPGSDVARGLDAAIVDRCASAGISPRVESAPGSGTSVILSWPVPPVAPAQDDPTPVEHDLEAILAESVRGIGLVLSGTGIVAAIALPPGPARVGCIVALLVVLGFVAVAQLRLLGRPAPVPGPAYPIATILVTWSPAVTLEGCGRSGSWNWGPLAGIAVVTMAILLDRRRWVIVASVGAYVLGNLQIIREVGPGAPACTQEAFTVLAVNLALVLGVLAYRRQVTRAWQDGRREHDIMVSDLAEAARAEQALRTRRELLDTALRVAEPVLLGLASGELDPDAPEVRTEAARAERILRSLAVIPVGDPGEPGRALTDLVLSAHERGVALTLSLNAGADSQPELIHRWAPMLAGALGACPPDCEVQVTILELPEGSAALVLIDPRGCAHPDHAEQHRSVESGGVEMGLVQALEAAGWTVTEVGIEVLAEARWVARP